MAEEIKPLTLTIKVNKQTGEMEFVGAQIKNLKEQAKGLSGSFGQLSAAATQVLGPLAALGTAAGLAAFFKTAITEAAEYAERIKFVRSELENLPASQRRSLEEIEAWAQGVEEATRFSDDLALTTLPALIRVTEDVGVAQRLAKVAMDTSVATGKNLGDVVETLSLAYQGNTRGLEQLKRMLGESGNASKDTAKFIEQLEARYRGAAEGEKSFTKEAAQVKNTLNDIAKDVGNLMIPSLQALGDALRNAAKFWKDFFTAENENTAGQDLIIKAHDKQIESLKKLSKEMEDRAVLLRKNGQEARATAIFESESYKVITESIGKLEAARERDIAKIKKHVEEQKKTAVFKPTADKAEQERERTELKNHLDAKLALIKQNEQAELAEKNRTTLEKVAIVTKSELDQVAAIEQARADGAFFQKEQEAADKVVAIHADANAKRKALEQQFTVDTTRELEQWLAKNQQVYPQILQLGLGTADGLAKGFSKSFADAITDGKRFDIAMQGVMKSLANAIIAELVRIAAVQAVAGIVGVIAGAFTGGAGAAASAGAFGKAGGSIVSGGARVGLGGGAGFIPQADGGDRIVDKPTMFMAGERGRERVTVTPLGQDRGGSGDGSIAISFGNININLGGGLDVSDPNMRRQVLAILGDELKKETSEAVVIGIRAANLAAKHSTRAS